MRPQQLAFLALILGIAVWQPQLAAQPVIAFHDPGYGWTFGDSLAIMGSDVLISDGNAQRVYLFDGTTTELLRTFGPPNPWTEFAASVAVLGGNILIGAPKDSIAETSGAVHVFDGATGALVDTLLPPSGSPGLFGARLAVAGDNLVVGVRYTDPSLCTTAYLFDGATRTLKHALQLPPEVCDSVGWTLAGLGSDVLVGVPSAFFDTGAVYLFDGTTGTLVREFHPPAGAKGFGLAITVSASGVFIGAFRGDGAVYLVDGATGVVLREFANPDPERYRGMGRTIAVGGGDAFVTAQNRPGFLGGSAVFRFDVATGALRRTYVSPIPNLRHGLDSFGSRIALLSDRVIVSAPQALWNEEGGAVFSFCGGASGCAPCETCGPLGTCVSAPHPACEGPEAAGKAVLLFKDKESDQRDRVLFRWRGQARLYEEFGYPPATHDYALCVFDESGPSPSLLFRAAAPAGGVCSGKPCWKLSARVRTFDYKDGERTPDGLKSLRLRAAQNARGRIVVRGVGENLSNRPAGIPALPLNLPARVQLQAHDGLCWEAEFSAQGVLQNLPDRFRARSD